MDNFIKDTDKFIIALIADRYYYRQATINQIDFDRFVEMLIHTSDSEIESDKNSIPVYKLVDDFSTIN